MQKCTQCKVANAEGEIFMRYIIINERIRDITPNPWKKQGDYCAEHGEQIRLQNEASGVFESKFEFYPSHREKI